MQPFDHSKATALFSAVMDSVRSFECVKAESRTFGLYNYSSHRAVLRRSLAATLQRELAAYGYRIDPDAGTAGSLSRFYMKLRGALGGGKRATVRELVRQETLFQHVIEVTLATVALPDDVGETLAELHRCVSESKLELTKLGVAARRQRFWHARAE